MHSERETFRLLGLEIFTFIEAIPFDGEVCYTNVEAITESFKSYQGMDISITDEQAVIVYDVDKEVARFQLQEDETFRKEMVKHLQSLA